MTVRMALKQTCHAFIIRNTDPHPLAEIPGRTAVVKRLRVKFAELGLFTTKKTS